MTVLFSFSAKSITWCLKIVGKICEVSLKILLILMIDNYYLPIISLTVFMNLVNYVVWVYTQSIFLSVNAFAFWVY